MREARSVFEEELRRRGIPFTVVGDGRYQLENGTGTLTVNLDNVARDFQRDGDEAAIARFIDRVLSRLDAPPWEVARTRVYWSAERFDHEFGDTLREPVSDTVTRVLVVTDLEHGLITWLTPSDLEKWNVSLRELREAADGNLDRLLADKRPEVANAGDARLGMIPVDSALKASVIFAPGFKQFVAAEVGWPVLVVLPCRDFVYVIAETDQHLLSRMGAVVQREFRASGYPITTEVLRISDAGIEAIGRFPD